MSKAFTSLNAIVANMAYLNKSRIAFMSHVLMLFLSLRTRINFLMLSRHSCSYVESSYRLHFEQSHDFATMNTAYIQQQGWGSGHYLLAFDASYIPKSGKNPPGLGKCWSGSASQALPGLELGLLSVIDADSHRAFHVDAALTPSAQERKDKDIDLVDHYAQVVLWSANKILTISTLLAVDAHFAKKSFVDRIRANSPLEIICLLRQDANLRYLYKGPKRMGKGAPKQYDGKINLKKPDLTRFDLVQASVRERIYSALVNCPFLKSTIGLAYVKQLSQQGEVLSYRPYFSTDLTLGAAQLVSYYRLRYQQAFLIRDAKQFTGLTQCQGRSMNKLEIHANCALTAVNIAKVEQGFSPDPGERKSFSMAAAKTRYHNPLLLKRLIDILPKTTNISLNDSQVQPLCNFGCIAA